MKKLLLSFACTLYLSFTLAQVGINTETPQTALDVNGSIQLRQELQVDSNPGAPGEIYFSKGNIEPEWKEVNVPFLEDGQYQLVNTYAKSDQLGIDWVGNTARVFEETFEANSPNKSGWTQEHENGSVNWNLSATGLSSSITSPRSGSYSATFKGANDSSNSTKLVSPVLDFSDYGSNLTLSFWYGQPRNGTNNNNRNYLQVYYRYSTNGGTTWTNWASLTSEYQTHQNSWTQVTGVTLTNSAGRSHYQIAFDALQRGTGIGNILDDIQIYTAATSGYNSTLSTLGETIISKNWVRIPGLDLPITINAADNKISVIFQTGVESRMNATGTGNQIGGNIRFVCGLFRRLSSQSLSTSSLVAIRGDQINNTISKAIENKTQSIFTLTYTVDNTPPGDYTFSLACRRLSLTDGGGAQASSFLSIGNAINSGNVVTNDFMLNSILKMDIIELVTITTSP